ncbi:hypothetical protein FACS189494_11560 [Spirochaetia bacterium]|nr:hypothetical protein FACS189494_11560 [Spirochaetia bacterium]
MLFHVGNNHCFDWWIKKINSAGNEVTTGWNKKLDFVDNYSTFSSDTHDKPTNAVIDSTDSIIVSDGYNTIKFASNGTESWRKEIGGTLYVDSSNSVFIVTATSITKYNAAGAQQWTKAYTGKLSFDSSSNVLVYSGDTLRFITAGGIESWTQIAGDIDTSVSAINMWYNSQLSMDSFEYWKFPVLNGNSYAIAWNSTYQGDATKTGNVEVSAYWEDDNTTSLFSATHGGWTTPKTFTATKTGNIIVKIETYTSSASYAGTYGIAITDWYNDGASITSGWYDSSLPINGSELRIAPVTQGKRYIVAWNDISYDNSTKTARVYSSAYYQDDESQIFAKTTNGWTSPKSFIATKTGNIVVKIETYSSSASYAGTYGVIVKELSAVTSSRIISGTINSATFDSSGNIYVAGYGNRLIDQYSKKMPG